MVIEHERLGRRVVGFGGQRDRRDFEFFESQHRGNAGLDSAIFVRVLCISANVDVSRCFRISVESSRQAVLVKVCFAWNRVDSDLMRLEESAHAVIVDLWNGVGFMVVAFRAIHGEAEEGL